MKNSAKNLIFAALLGLSGCASMFGPAPAVGDTEAETVAKRGPPSAVYQDGGDRLLSYAPGYNGQYSYMARIGPDGRLKSYEQVWTNEKFALIKPNVSTSADVLRIVGAPSMVQHYARTPNIGWNYGYREAGAWNSMMTVYVDPNGVVRGLENGPDPRYERDGMFGFGM
ncbi:hypothetical protein D9O50_03370 [Oxalobacteraceae bacterium CAVE-383]|nr:hypothetical protein D9O50_03370 [Oxalobacteraceae bacterium CAVE-383]